MALLVLANFKLNDKSSKLNGNRPSCRSSLGLELVFQLYQRLARTSLSDFGILYLLSLKLFAFCVIQFGTFGTCAR
jgi:hypothetical protein